MVDKLDMRYKDCVVNIATDDYKSVIDSICSAEYIISSSLHGIILAEAYGVPAVFYVDRPDKFNYKYEDWYQSTGRTFIAYNSIEEAIKEKAVMAPSLDKMRATLLDSFPYDLWMKS